MKRNLLIGLAFLAAFLIQTSLLNLFSIGGYTPNLLLCLVILVNFLDGGHLTGMVCGCLFGLLYDLIYSNVIGPVSISLLVLAAGILAVQNIVDVENIINMWLTSIAAIAVYYGLNWGLYHLAGNPLGFSYVFERVPWIALYSIAVVTVLYLAALYHIRQKRRRERR